MSPTYRSFAKINLHLRVVGRRSDGYHELETIFQTIDLADRLQFAPGPRGVELTVTEPTLPADPSNLAHRAASAFLRRWAPDRGVRIRLEKSIPVAGGLGGGSSNAATVLLALRELLGVPVPAGELAEEARGLGADVPYFLVGGTALGTGRGDQVRALTDLPERPIWLATPDQRIATSEIFGALGWRQGLTVSSPLVADPAAAIDWRIASRGWNDLETTVMERFPRVQAVYNGLLEAGASVVRLCGSGGTLFALFSAPPDLSQVRRKLPRGTRVVRARTLMRASVARLRLVK